MNEAQSENKSSAGKIIGFGCLGIVILVIVGSILAYVGIRNWAMNMVNTYTETQPAELPAVNLKQEAAEDLEREITEFAQAIDQGGTADPLKLNANQINHLLTQNPEYEKILRVEIEDDRLKGIVSAPLDNVGDIEMLKGRYFNGNAELELSFEDGRLEVYANSLSVKGKELPERAMVKIRAENLAKNAGSNPDVLAFLEKIETISIADGKLTIVPKGANAGDTKTSSSEAK